MGVRAADQTPRTHPNQFDTTYRVPLRPATDPAAESFSPSAVTTPVTPAAHPAVAAYHLLRAEPYPAGWREDARTCFRPDNSTAAGHGNKARFIQPVKLFIDVSGICPEKCHAAASASNDRGGLRMGYALPGEIHNTPVSSRDLAGRPPRPRRSAGMSGKSAHPLRAFASARRAAMRSMI